MMCGGLAAAAGHRSRSSPGLISPLSRWTALLAWQLGLVGSYSSMGAISGAAGGAFLALTALDTARHDLHAGSAPGIKSRKLYSLPRLAH